jgi:putative two-component system response regulator
MMQEQAVTSSEQPTPGGGARVLVVDDEAPIRRLLTRLLARHGYECAEASDTLEARAKLDEDDFELVLTDMNMPGDSGMELIQDVIANHYNTATVMVTGQDDTALANAALELGAYGYVVKPFQGNEILINVFNALRRRTLEIENRRHRQRLEQMVQERTAELWKAVQDLEWARDELQASRSETIERLSIAAEFRDDETAQHIHRMSRYCGLLARSAGADEERSELIRVASIMHDVGKIGIPDQILLKPGKLTLEEFAIMKTHAEIGHRILAGSDSELLKLAAEIALTHHEWFDGRGYPNGLVGEDIPFEGRVGAIADVFDALTSNRIYRRAYNLGEALEIMKQGRGAQFDPDLLDLFFDDIPEVLRIKERHE